MSAIKSVPATKPSKVAVPGVLAMQPDRGVRVSCTNCRSGNHCIAEGLPADDLAHLDEQGFFRRTVRRSEHLYRAGQRFTALYAVRGGFFKTTMLLEEGRTHVTGFHMAGDVIGTDGIGIGVHASEAIALEDSEICVLNFDRLEQLTRTMPSLQRSLHRLLSREIVREQGVMALLGGMSAEMRVAAFLLNLSYRFESRHYSRREFNLRMSREDIGSYLGLKLETVSRTLSRFAEEGLIQVSNKHVQIADFDRLHRLAGQTPSPVRLAPAAQPAKPNIVPLLKAS